MVEDQSSASPAPRGSEIRVLPFFAGRGLDAVSSVWNQILRESFEVECPGRSRSGSTNVHKWPKTLIEGWGF